ncbi:hypothetical protein BEL04_05185 [Mucilaginibacter sp. PPCGB 2223]|uniref:SPW repeat domain-containing protein n=1 Tax=Mucilaginibacter sp. PPCGB 2223 TaxID=1886027 RepID=UPI00082619F9|nr:SPW repeat protein [Mucilaginibacter sp. PPCGB 2223]OCX53691.1 hypothetical protein BEL04_05185 [Mucilaginibacter sp. PPCGB 2223]
MKPFISTTTYGIINYIVAALLLSSRLPETFNLTYYGGAALFIPILMGAFLSYIAIFSDNKVGFIKVFPMQMSLVLGMFAGFLLLVSPWLYDFAGKNSNNDGVFWPHVIFGAVLLFCALFTKKSPFTTRPHQQLSEGGLDSIDSIEGRLTH